jgi:hypothetical protein
VRNNGYTESYKRFYYRNIQAIIMQKSRRGKAWNIVLSFLAFVALVPVLTRGLNGEAVGGWIVSGVFAAIFALLLVINCLRGPTCSCHLHTAVQIEYLPSLGRMRAASKAIRHVRPLIEEVQGAFVEEHAERYRQGLDGQAENADEPQAAELVSQETPQPTALKYRRGTFHALLFGTLLVNAFHGAYGLLSQTTLMFITKLFIVLCLIVCVVGSLVRQPESTLPKGIKRLAWLSLGCVILQGVLWYVSIIASVFDGITGDASGSQYLDTLALTAPFDSPYRLASATLPIIISAVVGMLGLLALRRYRRKYRTPPPLASGS